MRRLLLLAFGCTLSAAAQPRHIVSLSPNATEMLYGIGAFGEVVGVSDYCTYPPEAKALPSVGGWHTPDLETLLALHPDLVIMDDGQRPYLQDKLKDLGFAWLVIPNHTVADVYAGIAALGRATGREEGAKRLIATTREALSQVARRTSTLPRHSVVLIVSRTPGTLRDLDAATGGSFLAELVDIAGGRIAVPPSARGYARLSKEDLLAVDPEVILDFIHGAHSPLAGDATAAWGGMPELRAVRAHRVYGVQEDHVPHASQRIAETAALFARLIHPEAR
jgi:iron complex transport system substrate-binding protein